MKFLLIDDEYTICELTAAKLRAYTRHGITCVDCAFSAEEALERFQVETYDVLITDICMEQMDGLELIRRAKQMNPSLICVIISAYDYFDYAKKGIELGVIDFWVKPYAQEKMYESIDKIFDYHFNESKKRCDVLDLALSEAVLAGGKTVSDIFRYHADDPRGCLARMVLWKGDANINWRFDNVLTFKPKGKTYMLLAYENEDKLVKNHILERIRDRFKTSIGISQPGEDIAMMYEQAKQALSLAWAWDSEQVIDFSELDSIAGIGRAKGFVQKSLSLPSGRLINELIGIQSDMSPTVFAQMLTQAYAGIVKQMEEVMGTHYYTPPPWEIAGGMPMGWFQPMKKLLEDLEAVRNEKRQQSKNDPVAWAKAYVAKHIGDEIDMAVVSNELNMSYPYFSKVFRKQTGVTFSEYVLDIRMREACRLLMEGEKVTEVSAIVGYQNANNFSRAFKRMYTVAPNLFRTKNNG